MKASMLKFSAIMGCSLILSACYNPDGFVPEEKKATIAPDWTDADVDAVVQVTYESIPAIYQIQAQGLPDGCHDVDLLRFKTRTSSDNAAEADAALLFVPGVLEGANGFEYIGRQLVYIAKTFRDKDIEVWAMDRRSNCLEDLTGMQKAEHAATVNEAQDYILGYYYENLEIDGKQFEGFQKSSDLDMLYEFGMQQTTEDMFAIIQHFVPDPEVSRKKVFVGGHSLGGMHTSLFLAWDLDGDVSTLNDVGANIVAGAVGFDTTIGSVQIGADNLNLMVPFMDVQALLEEAVASMGESESSDPDWFYRTALTALKWGIVPRDIQIPAAFDGEVIALPEAVGLLAAKAPYEESTVLKRLPRSLPMSTIFKFFHTKDVANIAASSTIDDFRYTNQAFVGVMFDDHFSPLSFLQTSIGHMNGGAIDERAPAVDIARALGLEGLVNGIFGNKTQHIAIDAGPNVFKLGEGPLYSWASMDQIASPSDTSYRDVTGEYEFTNSTEEMVRIEDFTRALYIGETNLTEWYFPMRILLDFIAAPSDYAPEYGLNSLFQTAYLAVPTLIVGAKNGLMNQFGPYLDPEERPLTIIEIEGMSHLDPMFATVNTPSLHQDQVAGNILDFVFENVQE